MHSAPARESQLSDSEWLARAERMNGERGVGFLALDGEVAYGIASAFLDENDPTQAQLPYTPSERYRPPAGG